MEETADASERHIRPRAERHAWAAGSGARGHLSDPAGPHHRSILGRECHRHPGAGHRRSAFREARPTGDRRKPARAARNDCRCQELSGRLHVDADVERPHDLGDRKQEPRL